MNYKVSVVIPTYKRSGEKLERALESVYNQTYKNLEIIVVDDNDEKKYSDNIKKTINKYPNLLYISHNTNKGACAARNTGIIHSTGEFIAFLDDDDTWDRTKIEKQIKKFDKPQVGLVYCGISYFNEINNKTIDRPAQKSNNPSKDLLIKNYIGSTSCGIVRRSSVIDVGMFDTNLKSGQDLDLWYRISKKYELDFVEECLLHYTLYSKDTITSNFNNRLSSNLYLKEKYHEEIKKDKELLTVYNLKILKAYLKLKRYKDGFKYILKVLLEKEFSFKYALKYVKA